MSLAAGARLGHYEIHGPLGAGGMGEVYRARDTRLDRTVAIKVLTAYVDNRQDQRQRFEREARVIASLNHPSICVLYDVGEKDGAPFIVMEYLEGETLAGRLERSPLPIDDAMTIAVEMLDALEHAHRRGVVHRDLKPSNVMLTRDGSKLLDFGLAKSSEVAEGSSSDTRTIPVTMEGTILGSLNYMAPEQLHGQDVDARTDLFAFGAVLYEMVTGRRAFTGPSNASVIAAILERQPEPIAGLAPRAPGLLDHIVTKCLAKNPDERWQSATDLKQALLWARAGVGGLAGVRGAERSWLRRIVPVAALLSLAIVVSFLAAVRYVPAPPDIASYRFPPIATESDYQGSPAWSPDGKTLAYVAQVNGVVQVMTRAVGSTTPDVITDRPFDCRNPFWNEDGNKIYFITGAGEGEGLYVVSAAGGESDPALPNVNVTAAALSRDGRTLAFFREEGVAGENSKTLWIKSMPDGEPKRDARFGKRMFGDAALAFSPDGLTLGIWGSINDGVRDGPRNFWVVPVGGGPERVALSNLPGGFPSFSWMPDSRHMVGTISQPPDTHLWLFDTTTGRAWPVTTGMTRNSHPSVDRSGERIAMNFEHADFDLVELFVDRPASATLLGTAREETDPAWVSGNSYGFVTDRMGKPEIWMGSRRTSQSAFIFNDRPLVTESEFEGRTQVFSSPAFAPGGQRFAFARYGATPYGDMMTLYVKTGSSRPVPLLSTYAVSDFPAWSPDGEWVAFIGPTEGVDVALQKRRVDSTEAAVVVARDVTPQTRPQWSPDAKWIAGDTSEGLALIPADEKGGGAVILSSRVWLAYAWLDDRHLAGIRESDDRRLMLSSIDIATKQERVLNPDFGPVPLTNFPVKGMTRASARSFVIGLARARSSIVLLEGLRIPSMWDRWRIGPQPPWQRTPQP